jgi:hypothetical protein
MVVIRSPATVTATGRSAPGFGCTLTRTVDSPRPDPGETLAHDTSLRAFHSHAAWVRRPTISSPPAALNGSTVAGATS